MLITKRHRSKQSCEQNETRLLQAMPCGTLSANRAIFSEEKTVRFLLVGENPKSPVTHRWCGCAFCGCFLFAVIFPIFFQRKYPPEAKSTLAKAQTTRNKRSRKISVGYEHAIGGEVLTDIRKALTHNVSWLCSLSNY